MRQIVKFIFKCKKGEETRCASFILADFLLRVGIALCDTSLPTLTSVFNC